MVDIGELPGTPTPYDFIFFTGNSSDAGDWMLAPYPSIVAVRTGAGVSGSDRITLIWADGTFTNTWVKVVAIPTNLGLSVAEIIYFGNAIGETGNSSSDAMVTPADEIGARNNPHTVIDPAPVDDAYDFNRDGLVGPTDEIIVRSNGTNFFTALKLITAP